MLAWRLSRTDDPKAAFDGEGARRFAGRWNCKGTAMVYTSSSLALAALEYFVHLDPDLSKLPCFSYCVTIPDDAAERLQPLPVDGRSSPPSDSTKILGSTWVARNAVLALLVPSAVIPSELNILLNPNHPRIGELHISNPEPFSYDSRRWKAQ